MQGIEFVFSLVILVMSVVAHELSHGYVARLFGDPTAELAGRLTINPIKHIDPIGSIVVPAFGYFFGGILFGWAKPVPYNPYNLHPQRLGELAVAAAGPLTNLLLAFIFGSALRIFASIDTTSSAVIGILGSIVLINLVLALFNSIPIPPLDGSKVLFTLLPARFAGLERQLEIFGLIGLVIFIVFFWSAFQPFIAWLFQVFTGQSLY